MASSKYLTQPQASPGLRKATLYGPTFEGRDAIAGPLAILAAGLIWCLAFDMTVPLPEPAPAAMASASEPATADVLAREAEDAMPDSTFVAASMTGAGFRVADTRRSTTAPADPSRASVWSLHTVNQNLEGSPHSLRSDRKYATAGLAPTRAPQRRP